MTDSNDEMQGYAHDIVQDFITKPIGPAFEESSKDENNGLNEILDQFPEVVKKLLDSLKTANIPSRERALTTLSLIISSPLVVPVTTDQQVQLKQKSTMSRKLVSTEMYAEILEYIGGSNPSNIQFQACTCIAGLFSHPKSQPPFEQVFIVLDKYVQGTTFASLRSTQGYFRVLMAFCTNTAAKMNFVGRGGVAYIFKTLKQFPSDMQIIADGLQVNIYIHNLTLNQEMVELINRFIFVDIDVAG